MDHTARDTVRNTVQKTDRNIVQNTAQHPGEVNLVEIWLRKDPTRWIAGAIAGIFAAIVMILFSMILLSPSGNDPWYALKLFAIPVIGPSAMEYGLHASAFMAAIGVLGGVSIFLGAVFAHMTGTNRCAPLFFMGVTWGLFGWIFINNLFSASFREVLVAKPNSGVVVLVWVVYGIGFSSVGVFDRLLRRK